MPKTADPLNDTRIKNLKQKTARYRVSDGNGLVLEVMPSSTKIWRFRYRLHGTQQPLLTIGDYPAIGLKGARKKQRSTPRLSPMAFPQLPTLKKTGEQ